MDDVKRIILFIFLLSSLNVWAEETAKPLLYHTPEEKRLLDGRSILEGLSVGALIELEASFGSEGGEDFSDLILATFELAADLEANEWFSGHAVFLWEEDDTEPIDLDEAVILVENKNATPFFMEVGRMYIPFGVFNSHFVSDSLVLEFGETRETGILFGYENDHLCLKAGGFNGDLDDSGRSDDINDAVLAFSVMPCDCFHSGAYWVSDIAESDYLQDTVYESEEIAGAGVFFHLTIGNVVFDVEYITALDDFSEGVLLEKSVNPVVWNSELGFHLSENYEFAIKVEGSDDLPEFPEIQYGVLGALGILDSVSFSIEYLHGDFFDDIDDRDVVTMQLTLEI